MWIRDWIQDFGVAVLENEAGEAAKLMDVLQFISSSCWKYLFGRSLDALERGADNPNEYIMTDNHPLCSKYISVPKVYFSVHSQS